MHKNGKWATQIIELQDNEGKWGDFHSLSSTSNLHITTEQALRRLEFLGYSIEDECIQKAVGYMNDCLIGKNTIPDRVERCHDWNVFSALMLATRIRRFTKENTAANAVAQQWAEITADAFKDGCYNHDNYVVAYKKILKPSAGKICGLETFYPVSLMSDCLDENTGCAFVDYILNYDSGIYYIYDNKISVLPKVFQSREASRYLGAIELLAQFKNTRNKLGFVSEWLIKNRNENNKWDMGKSVNDRIYFPLSDSWRKNEVREADCTERIIALLHTLLNREFA
jgi:hypothetical protein